MSNGIDPAWTAIAINARACVGVHTFICVGSTGAIQENLHCGDLIISSAAVCLDYTSNCYIMPEYPTAVNCEILLALIEAAEELNIARYYGGIVGTTADFYAGQNCPMPKGTAAPP